MSDWDASDSDTPAAVSKAAPPVLKPVVKSKWADEDEDDKGNVASDWEDSDEEEEKPKPSASAVATAPPKKKGTIKQKIAEKEAERARRAEEGYDDDVYDENAVLDPREKARRDREREIESDMKNAADLLGSAALGGTSDKELDKLMSAECRTKEDFLNFSTRLIDYVIKRHQEKPLYPFFVEHIVRELAMPLKDVEVRKAASGLTTLANEKQREAKDKASGKKKSAAKPSLVGAHKATSKVDSLVYNEALDDYGDDEFM